MNKLTRYLQGFTGMLLIGTVLPSLYTTPPYQDHYRGILWTIGIFAGIILFSWLVSILPYDKGFTPVSLGLVAGAYLSLFIDNLNKGVENYWTIGQVFTCLPDFVISVGVFVLMLRVCYYAIGRFNVQVQKA